jgi:hypothetical protein
MKIFKVFFGSGFVPLHTLGRHVDRENSITWANWKVKVAIAEKIKVREKMFGSWVTPLVGRHVVKHGKKITCCRKVWEIFKVFFEIGVEIRDYTRWGTMLWMHL